jgi:hypothetical protein
MPRWMAVRRWWLAAVLAVPGTVGGGPPPAAGPAPASDADTLALLEFLGSEEGGEAGWDEFFDSLPEDPEALPPTVPPGAGSRTGDGRIR